MKLQLKIIAKILDSKSNNSILFTVPQTKALATTPHKQRRKAVHPWQVLPPQPQQKTHEKAPQLLIFDDEPAMKIKKAHYQLAANGKPLEVAIIGERSPID